MTDVFASRWAWYASNDGGETYAGPCDTRAAAIQRGAVGGYGLDTEAGTCTFTIAECRRDALRFSDAIDVSQIDDLAHDGIWEDKLNEDGDALTEHVTPAQWVDLQKRLDNVANDWQAEHGIVIETFWFMETRNEERVTVPAREVAVP